MKKCYLGVIVLCLLATTNALSISLINDDTGIPIAGEKHPIKYGLLKYSKTIRLLLKHLIATEADLIKLQNKPLIVSHVNHAQWQELIPLLKSIENNDLIELRSALRNKELDHLISVTSDTWNYLDIQPLFNIAITIIADKINAEKKLVCNIKSLKASNIKMCPKEALNIAIPVSVEKIIAQKITPIITKKESTDTREQISTLPILGEGEHERTFAFGDKRFMITFEGQGKHDELDDLEEPVRKPITFIISEIVNQTKKEIYRDTETNIDGDHEFSFREFEQEVHKTNDNPLSFIIGKNIYTITEPTTILEAQIYRKKQLGQKLDIIEQKIYDALLEK